MKNLTAKWLCAFILFGWLATVLPADSQSLLPAFVVEPYIQIGNKSHLSCPESLMLMWESANDKSSFTVQTREFGDDRWQQQAAPRGRKVLFYKGKALTLYESSLAGLTPGKKFAYRVLKDGVPAFNATAQARKPADVPYRFCVFGDCGYGSPGQRQVAFQVYKAQPDFVVIPGDIAYKHGTLRNYRQKFFPVYNASRASQETGAPLLRSTLFVAAPGNHDLDVTSKGSGLARDLTRFPDGLGYFYLWSQPLNGPLNNAGVANTPYLLGNDIDKKHFLALAGNQYPVMANFSFDYGNSHWLILDGNLYVDWRNRHLQEWISSNLAAARSATWRFVVFHQPSFNSSRIHSDEKQMRVLSPLFERCHVDIVFSGHVHNYQRTCPLSFKLPRQAEDIQPTNAASGTDYLAVLDNKFNGQTVTHARGTIYLISGAGGAELGCRDEQDKPDTWQKFTCKYIADQYSFTLCDIDGKTLNVSQVSQNGRLLDHFTVTKQLPALDALH